MSSFNKYKDKNDIHVDGKFHELGGFEEMVLHAKYQFHRYLEQVINDPHRPNPIESFRDPEIRKLLAAEGLIGLTQSQIFFKAQKYSQRLAEGEQPYSNKLHPPAQLSESTTNHPVSILLDSETGNWKPFPTVI